MKPVPLLVLVPLILKNPFPPVVLPERMTWTASSMKLFRSCRRRWFWRYMMRLRKRQRDRHLMIGGVFHETLGTWYRGRRVAMAKIAEKHAVDLQNELAQAGDWFDQDEMDKAIAVAQTFVGMMVGYERMYSRDRDEWNINRKSIEYQFKVNMGDFDFLGKMDLLTSIRDLGNNVLVEHKTASSIGEGYQNRLPLDTQIRGYCFAAKNDPKIGRIVDHVLYDVIKKCKLRRKSGETLPMFNRRVAKDYIDRPSFYFWREPLEFSKEHLDTFEYELRQTHAEFKHIADGNVGDPTDPRTWLPNDSQCFNYFKECEYMQLCTVGLNRATSQHLDQIEWMHEELEMIDA